MIRLLIGTKEVSGASIRKAADEAVDANEGVKGEDIQKTCNANFSGSSGGLEVAGATNLKNKKECKIEWWQKLEGKGRLTDDDFVRKVITHGGDIIKH